MYYDLHHVNDYVVSGFETEKQYFVTGINCSIDSAYREMMITKKQYAKTEGILGFHAFQSFAENEVTPEQAHSIGVKLAEEMWGDRFEVIVSTHLNTNHYHNHFVINSVSFVDGKKYYDTRTNYAKFRELSDNICQEFGLQILEKSKCKKGRINYSNYYKKSIENDNYYTTAKSDLDYAIERAYSYQHFETLMRDMGYELMYRGTKILSIRREPYKKNIRIERCFGEEYSILNIRKRIQTDYEKKKNLIKSSGFKNIKKQKHKGLYGLFLHYCYLLKVFKKNCPSKKLAESIRHDIKELDQITKQTELLVKNKIETYEQFFLYKNEKFTRLDFLTDQRSKLWYQYKKVTLQSQKQLIRQKIDDLSDQIRDVREEIKLCEGIEERKNDIEQNIKIFSEEQRKEELKNECIRRCG